jgi:hypothetical protein
MDRIDSGDHDSFLFQSGMGSKSAQKGAPDPTAPVLAGNMD